MVTSEERIEAPSEEQNEELFVYSNDILKVSETGRLNSKSGFDQPLRSHQGKKPVCFVFNYAVNNWFVFVRF